MKLGCRAISPLIATIILISICVAVGLLIYSVFFGTAGTLSAQLNIQVVSVDIVKTSSHTLVSATIKNTGNKPISSCTVTIYGDSGTATLNLGSIDVGQTKSASATDPSGFTVTAGKTYPVKITASASDGSTLDKSLTVTCTS
ncbi:hypothetical protein J7L18_08605 [Candidatus Bathyarchaeota archaeon]|nr:hypothetical protein [Candidatus Bathyarchaeota archaeon]